MNTAATSATQTLYIRPGTVASTVEHDPDAWRRPRRWLRSMFCRPRVRPGLRPRRNTVVRSRR